MSQVCATSINTVSQRFAGAQIAYTYDVYWEESDITWDRRWDSYTRLPAAWVSSPFALACVLSSSQGPMSEVLAL